MPEAAGATRGLSRRLSLLVAVFLIAGVAHFVVPDSFERIVPSWVPAPRLMVYISGVAELAGAIGLLWSRSRRYAGLGLIALLVAVFPANIHMLQMARDADSSAAYQLILWMRLPLQPLLIWLVWQAAVRPSRNY
ncbi:MAG: DoxX family membrane protein [Gemmatimonas sp.]